MPTAFKRARTWFLASFAEGVVARGVLDSRLVFFFSLTVLVTRWESMGVLLMSRVEFVRGKDPAFCFWSAGAVDPECCEFEPVEGLRRRGGRRESGKGVRVRRRGLELDTAK